MDDENSATVSGTPVQGGVTQASGTDSVRIPAEDTGLDIVKTAAITNDAASPDSSAPLTRSPTPSS